MATTKIVFKNLKSNDARKPAAMAALRAAAGMHATARCTMVKVSKDGTQVQGRFPQLDKTFTVTLTLAGAVQAATKAAVVTADVQAASRRKRADTFVRGSSTFKCSSCGKLTRMTKDGNTHTCVACFEDMGTENEHADGHHADAPCPDRCKDCAAEQAAPAAKPSRKERRAARRAAKKERAVEIKRLAEIVVAGGSLGNVDLAATQLAHLVLRSGAGKIEDSSGA